MNLQNTIRLVTTLSMIISFALVSNAQRDRNRDRSDDDRRGRWEYLGQSRVDDKSDHDTMSVNARGTFREILFEVQGGRH